jgi:hypothetical protein
MITLCGWGEARGGAVRRRKVIVVRRVPVYRANGADDIPNRSSASSPNDIGYIRGRWKAPLLSSKLNCDPATEYREANSGSISVLALCSKMGTSIEFPLEEFAKKKPA